MHNDPIVEFAQRRHGVDTGLPRDAPSRTSFPDWLAAEAGRLTVPADIGNPIAVEGRLSAPDEPEPASDGSTAELFAFYLPFHFYRSEWGIYIRGAGLWALARRLALPKKLPDPSAVACAYKLLLEHERLHFFAEYAASRIEVVTGLSHYDAYFKRTDAALHEEALANARALHSIRSAFPKLVRAASAWMSAQGPGYCDYSKWLPPQFRKGERWAAAHMTRGAILNILDVGQHPAEFLFRNLLNRRVSVYISLDRSTGWLRIAKPFPKDFGLQVYVHSNDHKPPHIHIDCPPGTPRSRYRWPELTPLRGDQALRANEHKRLLQYLDLHGSPIAQRIAAIPWK